MILYHFTAREYLDEISEQGLTRGDVPLTDCTGVNAVWLTTDKNPAGHGLGEAREMTNAERAAFRQWEGVMPPEGTRWLNKRAVRITVLIPTSDRKLRYWPQWGRKRLSSRDYEGLKVTGGGKAKTWWLYFGVIRPTCFREIELLDNDVTANAA
jgi:hypothetical protein